MVSLKNPWTAAGVVVAVLSILALLKSATDITFVPLLVATLEWYDASVKAVLDALELPELIEWCLTELSRVISVPLSLSPDWRHVLVIILLYFTRDIANNVYKRKKNAALLIIPALVLAPIGAVGFGVLRDFFPPFAAAPPVLVLAFFEYIEVMGTVRWYRIEGQTLAGSWSYYMKETIWPRFILAAVTILVGIVVGTAKMTGQLLPESADPVLLMLPLLYVLMLAILLLKRGWEVSSGASGQTADWHSRLLTSNSGRLGLLISEVFGATATVLVFNYLIQL